MRNTLIYITAISLASPLVGFAQFGENVEFLGATLVSGDYYDVQVVGDYAFAVNIYGLMVFDVSNPDSIELIGSTPTPGEARALAISGTHAYVGDQNFGLVIVDILDPYNPEIAGYYQIGNYHIRSVFVLGDYAYLGVRSWGLYVFNISAPGNPTLAGIYDPGYTVDGVWVEDSLAYIADFWNGLSVVNISNPDSMFEIDSLELPGTMVDVFVLGNYAYIAAQDSGMRIVDISRPDSLFEVGYFNLTINQAKDVFVVDTIAYIAYYYSGLQIVNVADAENPTYLGEFDTYHAEGVFVVGEYAYLADGYGLRLLDVGDPTSPIERSNYHPVGGVYGVFKSGNYAYSAGTERLLAILDVSNPAEPVVVYDSITPGMHAWDVCVRDTLAYVAYYSRGMRIFNVADPAASTVIGSYDTHCANGVDVLGDYAYIADTDSGLRIINISDPGAPYEVGFCDSVYAYQVDVVGDYAYLACSNQGFHILDISDSTNPHVVGSLTGGGWAYGVRVLGDFAYLAWNDLTIVDISDPTDPALVDQISAPSIAQGIFVEDTLAYLVTNNGLFVYNVADTSNIVRVGYCETPGSGSKLFVANDTIYVADRYDFSIYHFTGPVGLAETDPKITPPSYLLQNYPNPFSTATAISYSLPKTSKVSLKIYDALGRLVGIPVDGKLLAGEHWIIWNPDELPSGVYFYRLSTDHSYRVKKMLYLK